jgi:OOP family OmpA-OmpF porin
MLLYMCLQSWGQAGFVPKNLGKNVNSRHDDFNPVISPDEKTLYFNRANHLQNTYGDKDTQDVWYCILQKDGGWSPAVHMNKFINYERYNAILAVSPDGKSIYISGIRAKYGKWIKPGISIVTKDSSGWGSPKAVQIAGFDAMNKGLTFSMSLDPSGKTMLLSFSSKSNKLSLYYSKEKNGRWSKPKAFGENINRENNIQESACFADSGRALYFSAYQNKNMDIFVSRRDTIDPDQWSDPLPVSNINSKGYESYFKMSMNEKHAYFTSNISGQGGTDLFKVKFVEDNPYLSISGKILNKNTGKPILNKKYSILINDTIPDSLSIDYDSSSYTLILPLGKKYVIKPGLEYHIGTPVTIDGSAIAEYTEKKIDLTLQPVPHVLLTGQLIDKITNKPVPYKDSAWVIVIDLRVDSLFIDSVTSTYTLKLPYGSNYKIRYDAEKYASDDDSISLNTITEYQVITKNLYGEKNLNKYEQQQEKKLILAFKSKPHLPGEALPADYTISYISGRVIDKKTGKPIDPSVAFTIKVDKHPDAQPIINKNTSEYLIMIPNGLSYVISGEAAQYYGISEAVNLKKEKKPNIFIKDLVLAPIGVGQSVRINNIFFEKSKAILFQNSYPELDKLVLFLKENLNIKIEVAGHTDNEGFAANNLILSQNRAKMVKLYLEANGIPSTQLSYKGYGSTKPLGDNKTEQGKASNRRVEFVVVKVK